VALSGTPYDLVLMDCQLPDLDGYEATRLIRWPATQVLNHQIPIVAMTAHAMAGDRERCLAAGMNDYLAKPIAQAALERAIERWTAASPAPVAPPPAPAAPDAGSSLEFDAEDLLERLDGNTELAGRVLSRFREDMPPQLAALAQAVQDGNGEAIQRGAHTVKGAAANAGGTQMRSLAVKMEQLCRSGEPGGAAQILPELAASFERTARAIEEWKAVNS
jgi:CheY-like chemotaxis protein